MNFTVHTPAPIHIQQDCTIDYTIRWAGLPIRWRTRIIDWTPKRQFIDLQIKGPYTLWHHQHTFTPSEEGMVCTDRVIYKIPGGPVGRLMHALMISKQLKDIFRFRRTKITEALGWVRAIQPDVEIRAIG
jgi:ligand-binding SRPBCC domain-containing protein